MLKYILFLTVSMFAFSSVALSQNAQINKITLKERKIAGEIPYQISNIAINGEPVKMNSSFFVGSAGDEWEKKLIFNFTNTSNKDITYLDIKLMLPPEDKSKQGALPTFFWFRSRTAGSVLPMFRNDDKFQGMFQDVPDLKPGETLQIKLQERYYGSFQRMIEKIGLSNSGEIKDVIIWVKTIGFSDGTTWGYGSYYKPDPNDPTKSVPIEKVSLRSADGRTSESLSSASPQVFCPTRYSISSGYVFCVGGCMAIQFYSTGASGSYVYAGSAYSQCFMLNGEDCPDSYPEDVWQVYICP